MVLEEFHELVGGAGVSEECSKCEVVFDDGWFARAARPAFERRTPAEMWSDASVGWYTTTVKLDLEAKGIIEKEGSPQILRLAAG